MMTNRERLLAILEGRSPDRIPWIPRIDIWHRAQISQGALPNRLKGMSLRDVERALGMGTPAREGYVYRTDYRNMEVRVRQEGHNTITEYITPKGTLRGVQSLSEHEYGSGIVGKHPVEWPLKTEADYDVWMYVLENTVFVPTYQEYLAYDRDVGDDGLPMVGVGDCPFHWWLQALAGYEYGYLHLADFPDRVEALLKAMAEKDREMWGIVARSPARLLLHGLHLSSQFTPPRYFDRHITPYYREFTHVLHANGKSLAMHADNDTSAILRQIRECFDMVECFVTDPMANLTLKEARESWGTSVIIWGGVPSLILEEFYPEEQFEAYMIDLFRTIAPGDAFILGIADNAMAGSMLSRMERITEMVEKYGNYPVRV